MPLAISMLRDNTIAILNEHFIGFSEVRTYATPRRLALLVKGMPEAQRDMVKEVFGPPKKAAFDKDGNPTKAAIGFANSQGVEVSDLVIKNRDKGEYVVAVVQQKGVAVRELLSEILRKIVLSLHFPKSMRWGNGSIRFVRPIHWILALFDGETIPFEIDGVKSGNVTKGHRFLSPGSFIVKEIASYINLLENNYVIVEQDERRRIILEGIARLASSSGGRVLKDDELLDTVTNLVEYPLPVLCEFPSEYLNLPKELLVTVMRGHQKYFAIEDEDGRLKNYFIVISNTREENSAVIRAGAERVIRARFEDARFYYEDDLKRPLNERIEDLKRVTFHERLGTLYDKTERVVRLSSYLSEMLAPDKKGNIERAAWLCKTDLISGVVTEFPELQGLMGKYYALHDGEDRSVAEAIMEQYLPRHSGDRLPETDGGAILSISDKIDNIAAFFAIGLTPTGSEDPFALRRQALAVIAILMEKGYSITLHDIIKKAVETLTDAVPSLPGNAMLNKEIVDFFLQRLEPLLSSEGHDMDIIQSILHLAGSVPLSEIRERLHAIKRFTDEKGYNSFLLAMKRINNIIPDIEMPALNKDLLVERQEKALYSDAMNLRPVIQRMLRGRRFYEALMLLLTLTEPVNNFFDGVLVMDRRDEIRLNRLALIKEIRTMAFSVADFSKLSER
ncbi:MAG: glycine--tRNA ligase subunit beta [Thermodesulfovibrionales bacterium]